jgi:hypothetical protein
MAYRWLADLVLVVHLAFIVFVVLGGLLVIRRPKLAWLHLPAAIWGSWIEFSGRICPLTPLENHFRRLGGQAGYSGGFIEHYITAIIYPDGLTRAVQITFGVLVVLINVLAYRRVWKRRSGTFVRIGPHEASMQDSSPAARNDGVSKPE